VRSWVGTAALAAALLAFAPGTADASYRTLARAIGNITQAPLDAALSPMVAWSTLNKNITNIEDTTAVRVAYYVPGYFWLLGLQIGSSSIRAVTGTLELLPGLFLLPFKADLDPLFDPVERGEGVVEFDNDVMDIKFGINYQSPAY
jgi:hypothetical protein